MTTTSDESSSRRTFIVQLASSAAVASLAACTTQAAPAPAPAPAQVLTGPPPKQVFEDSWTTRVMAAQHKAVFDSPEIDDGLALWQASTVGRGYDTVLGAGQSWVPVVVLRHKALPMALNDAMWDKYGIGQLLKLKDPVSGAPARRNPFHDVAAASQYAMVGPDTSIKGLIDKGGVILACNLAAMAYAGQTARRLKLDVAGVRTDFLANMAPGVMLQPSGIYAVVRAQDAGCRFLRST